MPNRIKKRTDVREVAVSFNDRRSQRRTRPLPPDVAAVAFLDINDVCAAVRMSASWIYDAIRAGRFPAPMRFGAKCSRWRAADIRDYLLARAGQAAASRIGAAKGDRQ